MSRPGARATGLLAATLVLLLQSASAEPPEPVSFSPVGWTRGRTNEIALHTYLLGKQPTLWTSFPCRSSSLGIASNKTDYLRFNVEVPEDAPLGIAALRVIEPDRIHPLQLVYIEDLPAAPPQGDAFSREHPARILPPASFYGETRALAENHYLIHGNAGERLTVDVLARRLGSQLDPVIRLTGPQGQELAFSDHSSALGCDARFSILLPTTGDYRLNLRDLQNRGDDDHFFHLRVGSFPLIDGIFPTAQQRDASVPLLAVGGVSGEDTKIETGTARPGKPWIRTLVHAPDRSGSSSVPMRIGLETETPEKEPNDSLEQAQTVQWPAGLSGRFESPNDHDWYRLRVEAKEHLSFHIFSRSLGSPCDPWVRLRGPRGTKLAEANLEKETEPVLDHTFSEAGDYFLEISEATHQSGAAMFYRVEIDRFRPGFELSAASASEQGPADKPITLRITADRKGYSGPIALRFEEPVDGLTLENTIIAKDKKETELRIKLDRPELAGRTFQCVVVGSSESNSPPFVAVAGTRNASAFRYVSTRQIPPEWDGQIGLLFHAPK